MQSGKGDGDRRNLAKFDVGYGQVHNFASNRVFQDLNSREWCFKNANGKIFTGFASRLAAIEAAQKDISKNG